MPLAFESLSHGTIAFGFFNIETDMLLLERYFLFADAFCSHLGDIPEQLENRSYRAIWPVYFIAENENIGDLMGAIHGVQYTGFIGKLYTCFPFPEKPENFKQNPAGYLTQTRVGSIIKDYAETIDIQFVVDSNAQQVGIGDYTFSRAVFHELIRYVWRGGYPRWKNEEKPSYLIELRNQLDQNAGRLFDGLNWDP